MPTSPHPLLEVWSAAWPDALAAWSRFTKLGAPTFCTTRAEEEREGLTGSFAMIRLLDHRIVISLRQVQDLKLDGFATEVLAHEIGHHVWAPGNPRDNARMLARIRRGLPSREGYAAMVANLYTDLLINDRLQRDVGLDMAGVYRALRQPESDPLWTLYMRAYEVLWGLSKGDLVAPTEDSVLLGDADLAARIIRAYRKEWLGGASRFAALVLPYLLEVTSPDKLIPAPWMDAMSAGAGEEIPDGLAELDDDELGEPLHPAYDPALTGLSAPMSDAELPGKGGGVEKIGGIKNNYRDPLGYVTLMQSVGVKVQVKDLVIRYYRELSSPHLIKFPTKIAKRAGDPLPEGLDLWDPGSPISAVDWVETVVKSPMVIPGVTTVERQWGVQEGAEPERLPVDLYLGLDCSGSMGNPAHRLSYPVVAGAVMTRSALRVGARVMVVLSGEPGKFAATDGYLRDERALMSHLTDYLGTGYAFGILRLKDAFIDAPPPKRPVHILVITDADIFHMLKEVVDGWDIAAQAVKRSGGGGTFVLNIPNPGSYAEPIGRLRGLGWDVHIVNTQQELVAFARAFSKRKYEDRSA
jgi:hypothetical protein